MNGAIRYGEWAPDRQGWFLGLSAAQWATVLLGGLPALVGAAAHRWLFALAWVPVWTVFTVLVVVPVAMVLFVVAAAGEVRAEMSGLITGAGLLGALFGALPALALAAIGVVAFPALSGRSPRTTAS